MTLLIYNEMSKVTSAKISGVVGDARVRENIYIYIPICIKVKISGGNVDEEHGGYLKMGDAYRNWEGRKIEGLVTFVQI